MRRFRRGGVDSRALGLHDRKRGLPPTRPEAGVGVKRDALVQMLLTGHAHEPGDTVADVVNAVTRLHESKLPVHRVSAVQARAGELAKAWALEVANG